MKEERSHREREDRGRRDNKNKYSKRRGGRGKKKREHTACLHGILINLSAGLLSSDITVSVCSSWCYQPVQCYLLLIIALLFSHHFLITSWGRWPPALSVILLKVSSIKRSSSSPLSISAAINKLN